MKDYAIKERSHAEAWRRLQESSEVFMRADVSSNSYGAVSAAHMRVFDEWIAAARALEESTNAALAKAAELK